MFQDVVVDWVCIFHEDMYICLEYLYLVFEKKKKRKEKQIRVE